MSGMLTMSGWHTLIDGNLEWLSSLDRTLERDHVIDCMRLLRDVRPSVIDLRADGINNLKEENAALRAQVERLGAIEEAGAEILEWIDNWSPGFTEDPDWPATRTKWIAAVLRETEVDTETGRE